MTTIYTEVAVDIDLDEFSTDDLVEELENRDVVFLSSSKHLILQMYESQQLGKDIQPLLNQLYWSTLGRII